MMKMPRSFLLFEIAQMAGATEERSEFDDRKFSKKELQAIHSKLTHLNTLVELMRSRARDMERKCRADR